ncbi:MAG TPA: DUF1223 domain-containing protein [Terriglobales bacterium]|nr:DUF1223 domain-containing protein [Terriglobales bacterium]
MRHTLILLLALSGFTRPAGAGDAPTARIPILVELFTSEGCSDCPPADAFLQQLDRQPFPGAEMVVLSEHVDYWNHDGWKDPYSSSFFSERQAAYAREFTLPSVYTPEMVVDGSTEFVGSNQAVASKAFAKALTATKVDIRLTSLSVGSDDILRAHVETAALPKSTKADLYAAVALNHAESQVSAGENAGRRISHTSVARSVTRIAPLRDNQPLTKDVQLKLPPDVDPKNARLVVFIQESHQGKVLGATMQPFSLQ